MADVQFNDNYGYNQNYGQQKVPKLVGLVMKAGLAKDVRRANMILIGIAIASIVLAFIVYPRSAPITDFDPSEFPAEFEGPGGVPQQ